MFKRVDSLVKEMQDRHNLNKDIDLDTSGIKEVLLRELEVFFMAVRKRPGVSGAISEGGVCWSEHLSKYVANIDDVARIRSAGGLVIYRPDELEEWADISMYLKSSLRDA